MEIRNVQKTVCYSTLAILASESMQKPLHQMQLLKSVFRDAKSGRKTCAEHRFLAGGRPGALFSEKVRNLVIFSKHH